MYTGLSVSSTVFGSTLLPNLRKYASPDAEPYFIRVKQSVTDIYTVLPVEFRAGVIEAYVKSLRIVFLLGVITGAYLASRFIRVLTDTDGPLFLFFFRA